MPRALERDILFSGLYLSMSIGANLILSWLSLGLPSSKLSPRHASVGGATIGLTTTATSSYGSIYYGSVGPCLVISSPSN